MFKVNDKKHQDGVNRIILVFLLLTFDIYCTFSSISIVDFEQVHVRFGKFNFLFVLKLIYVKHKL